MSFRSLWKRIKIGFANKLSHVIINFDEKFGLFKSESACICFTWLTSFTYFTGSKFGPPRINFEEMGFEMGNMKLILGSIFLVGSLMSETCSYLDSSAASCSEIESLIPKSCESDTYAYLPLERSESEAIERQGCTNSASIEKHFSKFISKAWYAVNRIIGFIHPQKKFYESFSAIFREKCLQSIFIYNRIRKWSNILQNLF